MTLRRPASTAFAVCFSIAFALSACATLGEPQAVGEDDEQTDPDNPDDEDLDPAQCLATGDSGEVCEVTGDCEAPLVCLGGVCVGPNNPDDTCDPVEGIDCQDPNAVCVGRVCVLNPGECVSNDECPLGYICSEGQCAPERDGEACADVGPGPDLNGTWKFTSTLHLRDGMPDVIDGILDVTEIARDIIEGDLDLGLPGFVESILGSAVASIIDNYIPSWAQNLVVALGDVSDILDTLEVDSTVTFSGEVCDGTYRGKETWNFIRYDFRGTEMVVRPDQLPGVDEIVPDEFAAWYSCGELYIDRHRVSNSLSGLVRFVVDNVTNAVSGHPNIESALSDMVDCYGFAVSLDNYLYSVCSSCPIITGLVDSACESAKNRGIQEVTQAIDNAAVKMSLLKKKGIATVSSGDSLTSGTWYGSLVGGDFPGEFTATRQ